jgi:hypothetical protein
MHIKGLEEGREVSREVGYDVSCLWHDMQMFQVLSLEWDVDSHLKQEV